jgi:hypothetical protein
VPPISLNLDRIRDARAELARLRQVEQTAAANHRRAKARLESLRRSGASQDAIARMEGEVARLSNEVKSSAATSRELLQRIGRFSEELTGRRDPGELVSALSATHPVALLPVAVQTRYDDAVTKLMIRIYPDVLHAFAHEPGLLENEAAEGKRYWSERFANPADAESPWTHIARILGPARAAHVVRTTTPTNVDQIGRQAAPVFPDTIPVAASESRQLFAEALPDRFVAIGFKGGQEIFRKWGRVVADQLPLSPLFDPLLMDDPSNTDPFAGDRAWLVDYAAAESAGMAITVTPQDVRAGAQLSQGVDRLVVLGVDWTQTPESAGALLASLLDSHYHNDGLAFVAQGTPTNNTAAARAGFSSDGSDVVGALDPAKAADRAAAVADELASAGARFQLLLGIPRPTVRDDGTPAVGFDAGLVPGATLVEGATSGHMINALWNATIGYTLRFFWNPIDSSQTLISDEAIDQLRAFAVRYLRPGGPLSALRVGNTPYGILPLTARAFVPKANSPLERELFDVLTWFRTHWDAAISRVPTLQNPAAENLHQVLAMQPWALTKRFWQVAGPAAVKNYPDIEPFAMWQGLMLHFLVASLLDQHPFNVRAPFLATCAVRPKPTSLDVVPWVQRDPAQPARELADNQRLARNYIADLLRVLSQPTSSVRSQLVAMQNGESLLEAMLAFAADEEVLHSGRTLFRDHIAQRPNLSAAIKAQARRLRPAEYVGVDVTTQMGDQFDVGHAQAVLGVQLEGTTANQTVEQFIGSHFGTIVANWPEQLKNIASFTESLAFLKDRTCGELGHAFRTTLDLYSHRLDAWITSLATKRLDEMRERAPEGVHLGAFGFVENLRPDGSDQAADTLGYVHAPSLQQAATAAILRSGHLANRQSASGAFNIDLRSHRVKRAKRLIEGLANGQSLAALLGYRFERALRDNGLPQHILELRRAFPLIPSGSTNSDEPQEAIAARHVVDGVRIVAEYREHGIGHIAASVMPLVLNANELSIVGRILDDLVDQLDSVADLLLAESVFQVAGGNMDGAGAAMAALDRQERPPEVRCIDTPHSTRGYTQRVVVALQDGSLGPWSGVADDDLAARVEPRLNAWLASLLGDPANYVFGAKIFRAVRDSENSERIISWEDSGETLQATLPELGLSPLALVLGSEALQAGGQSAVQERIGAVLSDKARARPNADPENESIVLDAVAPEAGKHGLVAFESFAWLLRRLLEKARPLRRMDMVRAENGVEFDAILNDGDFAGVDIADFEARLAPAEAAAQAAIDALKTALAPVPVDPDDLAALDPAAPATVAMLEALRGALQQAHALGWRAAVPSERVRAGGPGSEREGERLTVGDEVEHAALRARALLAEITGRLDAAPLPTASDPLATRAEAVINRVRAILGKSFPILPRFTLGAYAPDAAATLGDRSTLLDGDDLAIAGWLPKLGCVREGTALLSDVLTAAEAMGHPVDPAALKLLQFPRDASARWAALPPKPKQDLRGVVAVVAHAPGALEGISASDTISGLFVDEWSESIPALEETTGLGFHFDAPGARPPQAVLLAVPSDPSADHWTLDGLLAVVDEAIALARLRAVRPQDLDGLGLILPGIFLSNNFKQDVPTIDFGRMVEANLSVLRAIAGQNSTQSFMKMAEGTTALFE